MNQSKRRLQALAVVRCPSPSSSNDHSTMESRYKVQGNQWRITRYADKPWGVDLGEGYRDPGQWPPKIGSGIDDYGVPEAGIPNFVAIRADEYLRNLRGQSIQYPLDHRAIAQQNEALVFPAHAERTTARENDPRHRLGHFFVYALHFWHPSNSCTRLGAGL